MGAGASASLPFYNEAKDLVYVLATSESVRERVDALKKLDKWAEIEEHKVPLCHPSLGFVEQLMRLLRNKPDHDELNHIIYCFIDLSQGYGNKPYLGSAELGLGKEFVKYLPEDNVYNTYTNLVMRHETHSYLLSREVGLMDFLMARISKFNGNNIERELLPCKILANVAGCLREANLELFMSYDPHIPMIQRLKSYSKNQIQDATNNVAYWCLNFVLRYSHFPDAAQLMRELVADFIESITVPNTMVGLKCIIISANLTGRQEGTEARQTTLQTSPQTFDLLLTLFKSTLNLDLGPEYHTLAELGGHVFGGIKMRNIVGAVRTLSISDTNKPLLLKTNVLALLIETLNLYASNAEELKTMNHATNLVGSAGGGGDDGETAELTIEALLQLSFNYESDEQLCTVFLDNDFDLVQVMKDCVSDWRSLLRSDAKRNASSLLTRLTTHSAKSNKIESIAASSKKDSKHVMLSYAWAANKPLVVALGKRLKELGYEVWRDEEGNSIVGPMQGDTDEKMAAAVEASHTVVICVSPQYKESANCRMEAKYSRQRQISHSLRIVYVMMNENYTTRSNPPVDGWLALNIGTDLWYPLWHNSMVESTAQMISDLIQKEGITAGSGSGSGPSMTRQFSSASTGGNDAISVDTAWSVLHEDSVESEVGAVAAALNKIGLMNKEDLTLLEESEVQQLAVALKAVPKKKFLKALGF